MMTGTNHYKAKDYNSRGARVTSHHLHHLPGMLIRDHYSCFKDIHPCLYTHTHTHTHTHTYRHTVLYTLTHRTYMH